MAGCSDCGKLSAGEQALDVLGAVAASLATGGRWLVRAGCHWFADEALERGRVQIRWKLSWLAAAAAGLTWWLGRPAAFVFAGAFVVSWALHHALRVELERRRQRELVARRQGHERARLARRAPKRRVTTPEQDLDAEAAAMIAAHKATEDGR